ncbi:MAG: alpha/beta hydrolase [Sedimentitalea sp.]
MLKTILFGTLIGFSAPLIVGLGLILSQSPQSLSGAGGLDFEGQLSGDAPPWPDPETVTMRDGFGVSVRTFEATDPAAPLVVLVHGSGWHGQQFARLAPALTPHATVLVPDLRGHGATPGQRGDVSYIGQLEDDLADLIKARRTPGQKVVLAGHSSGGGLAVRFAGGAHGGVLDGAILLAPYLHHRAPTFRPNSGGWSQPLTRRLIGLGILNTFRIRALNHLTVMQFNMPRQVLDGPLGHTATLAYSQRLNMSYAPRNAYLKDVAKLPPFVLIAGADDEAFLAQAYEPTLSPANPKGAYHLIAGINHLDVVNAPQTLTLIARYLDDL